MSYIKEVFTNRQIAEAARSLDLMQAGQTHKLAKDSGKHALLAKVMKEAGERFMQLANAQSVYSADEFFRRALERVNETRREQAALAKMRREKREREAAERAEIQAMGQLAA